MFQFHDIDKGIGMKWIGLTGGIATGKSTVKNKMLSLNMAVIDADVISHELTQVGASGYKQIVSLFGKEVLNPDQTLNRKQLGHIVFNDTQKLFLLEQILHPLIQAEVQIRKMSFQQQGQALCFYDVPLLFEKKLEAQFDLIVLVYAPSTTQVERLRLRNNLTSTEAMARLQAQIPIHQKVALAKYCLDNSTNQDDLDLQVLNLVKTLSQNQT